MSGSPFPVVILARTQSQVTIIVEQARAAVNGGSRFASFDDFDDSVRSRIDQDGPTIDHRIAVVPNTVLRGDVIIGHPILWQICADSQVAPVSI